VTGKPRSRPWKSLRTGYPDVYGLKPKVAVKSAFGFSFRLSTYPQTILWILPFLKFSINYSKNKKVLFYRLSSPNA
jgi:hypothetical protein